MGKINTYKPALLITGTIVPNSNFVAHTNIEQRRQEYYEALLFYAEQFKDNDLFFLENSSYDFNTDEPFKKLFSEKNITLMKFPVSDKFIQGKGYQEFEMLDQAIEKLASLYTYFIKITGRYKVLNIKELMSYDCVTMTADSHKKLLVTQTNVFMITAEFYQTIIKNLYLSVNDGEGYFIEHAVYQKLVSEKKIDQTLMFPVNPIITGFSGSYGGTLNRNKYKMIIRNIERKLLRILGIHQFLIEY